MKLKSLGLVCLTIIALGASDLFYFKTLRNLPGIASVDESVVRNGVLGKLLRHNGLIQIDSESIELAKNDLCANEQHLTTVKVADDLRLRIKIASEIEQDIKINIAYSENGFEFLTEEKTINVHPQVYHYDINFKLVDDLPFTLKVSPSLNNSKVLLSDIQIDNQLNQTFTILKNGVATSGRTNITDKPERLAKSAFIVGIPVNSSKIFTYANQGQLPSYLKKQGLPGTKPKGYCRYSATPNMSSNNNKMVLKGVPRINIQVEDRYLDGKQGILNNLTGRKRSSEVPAVITLTDDKGSFTQTIGLRFHGGQHRRKENDLKGYRLYARPEYGSPKIGLSPYFGTGTLPIKTLVLRANQAYGNQEEDYGNYVRGFNPYNHALALDIGRSIGAIVSRSKLVDLQINNSDIDLYLALEHQSKKSIANALGHKNFELYTYKKRNDKHTVKLFQKIVTDILSATNDNALTKLQEYYDLDNVLNSIILRSYISDNDYCQGTEIIESNEDSKNKYKITTVDWDMDHAFFYHDGKRAYTDASKFSYHLIQRTHRASRCPRRVIYSHVYTQSLVFRKLVREKLETLLENELSTAKINQLVAKYEKIDKEFYNEKYANVIKDIREFITFRPTIMREMLTIFEDTTKRITDN